MLVIFHIRYIPNLEVPHIMERIISHLGSGVPFFFAISAFSLMLGYETCLDKPGGLAKFFKRRFFRITPLFYFMLLVWLLVNTTYLHSQPNWRAILSSMTYTFGLLPGQHEGIVWASWSIGVEWIFYALFPIFILLTSNLRHAVFFFVVSLAISVNTPVLLTGINQAASSYSYLCFLNHLVFFSSGILAFRIVHPSRNQTAEWIIHAKPWVSWIILVAGIIWLISGWKAPFQTYLDRLSLGVYWVAGAWCAFLICISTGRPWILDNIILRQAGKLSFGLYLLNPPIIYALSESGFYRGVYAIFPEKWLGFSICSTASMVLIWCAALLAHNLIERPGIQLGERII